MMLLAIRGTTVPSVIMMRLTITSVCMASVGPLGQWPAADRSHGRCRTPSATGKGHLRPTDRRNRRRVVS
uniref:Putative secreted protein n=1 Tax=Anopheles darlingi TaxID=43151 RepID=A0A2M4DQ17_ANODA